MTNEVNGEAEMISMKNIFKSFRFWPRVFRLLWETNPVYLSGLIILNILKGLVPAISLLATQRLINSVITAQEAGSFKIITEALLILVTVTFVSELLSLVHDYLDKLFQILLSNQVNVSIIEKSISLALSDFENPDIQDKLKRAQEEAGFRPYSVFTQMLSIISGIITLFSCATILFIWKWWVAVILIFIPLVSFITFLRIGQKEFLVNYRRAPESRQSWYVSFLLTKDHTFKEVKLYHLGPYLLGRYKSIIKKFYAEDKKLANKRSAFTFLFQMIDQVIIALIMALVLWAAFLKEIMIGNVVSMIQAISVTQSVSQGVIEGILSLAQNSLYIEQLFDFLDLESTSPVALKAGDKVPKKLIRYDKDTPIKTIEFQNVSYQYPEMESKSLKNISFIINRGETVAIVGRNGSGKTTLVKLLTQLYQDFDGEILINGRSIREIDSVSFREMIGVVFQDFIHYEMSVRHNIAFGDLEKVDHDQQILKAAGHAGIRELINNLPKKLETNLGRWFEEGHQLSGGQWQRMAIARAFMRDACIYILDEPSSFLDPQAESEVFESFRNLVHDRIGIFISHRFSSAMRADKILVMDAGDIVEFGDHAELVKQNGLYAELYNLQASAYLREGPTTTV